MEGKYFYPDEVPLKARPLTPLILQMVALLWSARMSSKVWDHGVLVPVLVDKELYEKIGPELTEVDF